MKIENITSLLRKTKERKPTRLKIQNYTCLAKDWEKDFRVGKESENTIYTTLENDGYTVIALLKWRDIGEETKIYTLEQKIAKAQEDIFLPDALLVTPNLEYMFIDCKGKTKATSLGYVNVRDYHKYWNGKNHLHINMRIYFHIKETKEIWYHDLRNPSIEPNFPTKMYSDAEVYIIPREELTLYKKL